MHSFLFGSFSSILLNMSHTIKIWYPDSQVDDIILPIIFVCLQILWQKGYELVQNVQCRRQKCNNDQQNMKWQALMYLLYLQSSVDFVKITKLWNYQSLI